MGDDLRFVFRNFPLSQVHPFAESAAEAAEAAAAQGKFVQMHDLIFENQDRLEPNDLVAYARQAGLDIARFEQDMESGAYSERVREDFMSGVRSGVNGTPTFFINGNRYEDSWDFEPLLAALRSAPSG
jgi:protein-disulfide isomerase